MSRTGAGPGAGRCLSSYMELVIPVVAMLSGRGLRELGADRRRTPARAAAAVPPLMALPGLCALAVEFSRDIPGQRTRG